jgi:fucose 4-O-acetylase-like acetyltransferase
MKKRIEWVDIGKYICIMFVMLSHLESRTELLYLFYTPFALKVFFFLAGYVHRQPVSFKEMLIKKVKGLIVPWFILSNVLLTMSAVVSFKKDRNIINDILWNLVQIRPHGDVMWFVPALFVAFIPFYFIIKYFDKKRAIIVSLILALASELYMIFMPGELFFWGNATLPWHLEYMFRAAFWMVLGYYYRLDFEYVLEKYNTTINLIIIAIVYLIMVYSPLQFSGQVLDMLYSYVKSAIGVTLIIMICKRVRTNKYIAYVGGNTLIYFAFHGKLYSVIEHVLRAVSENAYIACLSNVISSSLLAIVITIVMSFVLIIPSYVINRWFPWVLGRSK